MCDIYNVIEPAYIAGVLILIISYVKITLGAAAYTAPRQRIPHQESQIKDISTWYLGKPKQTGIEDILAGATLWLIYGFAVGDVFIIGTNVAAIALMLTVYIMKKRYDDERRWTENIGSA